MVLDFLMCLTSMDVVCSGTFDKIRMMQRILAWLLTPGHEHKLFSPSRVIAPKITRQLVLASGISCHRFYSLEVSPNDSSLERVPTLSKRKKRLSWLLRKDDTHKL